MVTKIASCFLGVVVLIALSAGGGFYVFAKQKQKKQAEKAVGETECLSPLKNKEACKRWKSMTDKERNKEDEKIKAETPSTEYTLSGYLDNQADDFPEIHQTWHGAEGYIYNLVSEK